ncbi:MAG TPA: hypothetical protein PL105_16735, partial [Caldilineaceae bacterium]|nr:hypothetical protein [Caldilineaceae bacterium]
GVPVVPTAARQGEGLADLLQAVHEVATGEVVCKPFRMQKEPKAIKGALDRLVAQLTTAFPGLPNARWVALRLLDGDESIVQAVRSGELGQLISGTPDVAQRQLTHPRTELVERKMEVTV